jgi:4-amino-4-deoxy-L-arabinose transferase-like glycosyltransferase
MISAEKASVSDARGGVRKHRSSTVAWGDVNVELARTSRDAFRVDGRRRAGVFPGQRFVSSSDAATRNALCAIALLTALRFVLALTLPLSFDEAYYWLWSKHLAIGYYDHPPLIAFAIRGGTLIFGNTEFGVRFVSLIASIAASWAVWRSAALLLPGARPGPAACLLFNATLMIAAETMAATPDSLLIAIASFLMWTIAKLETTHDGRWWLAAGLAAGTALITKLSGLFLCGSLCLWLLASPIARPWLRTFWPYAGALITLLLFAPFVYWNAEHNFISFRFQFARVSAGHLDSRFLLEFVAGQMALASPFILALAGVSLARNSLLAKPPNRLGFAAAMVWPAILYFLFHALHARVQGNWPGFVYPALAVLAAQPFAGASRNPHGDGTVDKMCRLALPAAGVILTVAYAQAFFGLFPIGLRDPIARTTGVGIVPVVEQISARASLTRADAIVTTNYVTTSWLAFYLRTSVPIVQVTDSFRFLSSPLAMPRLLQGRLLWVTQHPDQEMPAIRGEFSHVAPSGKVERLRHGVVLDEFDIYTVSGLQGPTRGRRP